MNTINHLNIVIALFAVLLAVSSNTATAQNVDARLSSQEAYVGMPIVLQLSITNAKDYQGPELPEVDGCDIRSAGAPSQSSQITIINGRRSESRSVTMQYLVTPRRAGGFEIPPIRLNVNGREQTTRPLRFVATQSETGDLLFVEIEGKKPTVYVGQPLDLKLKIWIKPYRDRENQVVLSEAHMWQLISEQTSWGGFADRLRELGEMNQRPGGREVIRDDRDGNPRSYYQYEIDATVYPTRPGKMDASDVQVVVNYPTALGRSRDPFEEFFRESRLGRDPLGGNSMLKQMMDDDFFSSPFGRRLTVSASRPIVAQASVDSTEVLPIPAEGRPDDYRGAVGRYRIVTQASPTAVNAGDPITINIGITGTGPMELIQAPPLTELPALVADFKVPDQSLAGFVQDDAKVFSTTIRPRREGITEIPAIPFSFFDPDSETFETVFSEPISITVDKAETLSLDAIVANSKRGSAVKQVDGDARQTAGPDLTISTSPEILSSQTSPQFYMLGWIVVLAPSLAWLVAWFTKHRGRIGRMLPEWKSARTRCLVELERASDGAALEQALTKYIARRMGHARIGDHDMNWRTALGLLRTNGQTDIAADTETFYSRCQRVTYAGEEGLTNAQLRREAHELLRRIEERAKSSSRQNVRRRKAPRRPSRKPSADATPWVVGRGTRAGLLLALATGSLIVPSSLTAHAARVAPTGPPVESPVSRQGNESVDHTGRAPMPLSLDQRRVILEEASQVYIAAQQAAGDDVAESVAGFEAAAAKYQLLADSGPPNSRLLINLANAYLQCGKIGYAIANYQRALQLEPGNAQIQRNLEIAQSQVSRDSRASSGSLASQSDWVQWVVDSLRVANQWFVRHVGVRARFWILAVSSVVFWGLLIIRTLGWRVPVWRLATVPLIILILSVASMVVQRQMGERWQGIVVAERLVMHQADGRQFDVVHSVKSAEGQPVQILMERQGWLQVKTTDGIQGWVPAKTIQQVWPL